MTNKFITEALKALPAKADAGERKLLERLLEDINAEDFAHFTPALLKNMVSSHWNLAKSRSSGAPQVGIYCSAPDDGVCRKTVIDVVSDDMAFLVDSVVAEINKCNCLIGMLLHPVIYVKYDKNKNIEDIVDEPREGYIGQSHVHIQIKQTLSDEALASLEEGLYEALNDVCIANQDWPAMLQHLKAARDSLADAPTGHALNEIERYCAFLDYLHDNNFTLLGYREYEFVERDGKLESRTVKGKSLGLLSNEKRPAFINEREESLPRNLQELRRQLPPVSISKTNRVSTVHRSVPMDAIAIKIYDDDGKVVGERLFLGLFTSVTYSRSVTDVPYLREKVAEVVALSGLSRGTHDRKALRHILEKYPRDELFQISQEELLEIVTNILRLQERQRIALFMRRDQFKRYISCLVYVPRDRFGTRLRMEMQEVLEEELNGKCSSFYTTMDDAVFARVMFIINVDQNNPPQYDPVELEKKLREMGQTWTERLSDALVSVFEDDEDKITALTLKYGDAFPIAYTVRYSGKQSVFDIRKIEDSLDTGRLVLDLYQPDKLEAPNQLRLKVYNPGKPLTLSDVMPILDNMGLRAISELPFEVNPGGCEESVWIHDFLLQGVQLDEDFALADVKAYFERAFTRIWYNEVENDPLNRLVLSAPMNWHETTILRAYVRYLKQIRSPFSQSYIETALNQNPSIARMLVDLFKARHNPGLQNEKGQKAGAKLEKQLEKALEAVESLDQDRILRMIVSLVKATLRTNYYQRQENGKAKPYLSMKLNSAAVPDLPAPVPYRETFVYSPRVEGIHLRGDKIARGGLRWSDRHEDFRTEILGLMKSQMVKNAVIVPMGAKGGFVVKTDGFEDRAAFHEEGVECYKIFIRALLDLADNRKGTKIVPPADVVRHDGDDPYLVVAADKGTATFSDIANGLSGDYGFWLGDAFASGGSAGYDHKKMGITARGAWESVKNHFRQLNHDTQATPFDVIGVGDMGGDVFGNGMLLSKKIGLIGAFNHLHIFCDPDPDPATSYKERKRLFDKVKGWGDYDESKLSKGGRIYSRADKILELTPEIQERFDLKQDKVTPIELLRAMLKSRTDLLWFGGIGTYIKACSESHADAGDKANDSIRINATELRAKVIGEGANLGVTQLGRIEFASHGGRVNTDFLDNSGGVDSSDHEVNIKILMTQIMSKKAHNMDLPARNKLLERMTDEVADHVLRNNYQQAQAISLIELQARENLQQHEEFIRDLEHNFGLDRAIEGLPSEEQVDERLRTGRGLTRPELCVLLSYAKIQFTQELLESDIPDAQEMRPWLMHYFPDPLREAYEPEIQAHRLSREIISTIMSNSLINRLGPTFLHAKMKKLGVSATEIAKAYIIVRDAFGLGNLWKEIEALDNKVPAEVQLKAMREIAYLTEHAITWFLTRLGRDLDIGRDVADFKSGIAKLQDKLDDVVADDLKESIALRIEAGVQDGLPKALAHKIALMPALSSACDIIRIAVKQKTDLFETAQAYFGMGKRFHLDWLRQQARYLSSDDHWQGEATMGLIDQLYSCQAGLTVRVLKDMSGKKVKGRTLLERWFEEHAHIAGQLEPLFDEFRRVGGVSLPMLIIAEQRLRNLYGG